MPLAEYQIKKSSNQRYECHWHSPGMNAVGIPPNQRQMRVWHLSKSTQNARMAFCGYEYHLGIPPNQRRIRVWYSSKSTPNARLAFGGYERH